MKINSPEQYFAKLPKSKTDSCLISRTQIQQTHLVSANSTVGKIWACKTDMQPEALIFKEFIDGRMGVGNTREENDCVRDLLLAKFPIFSELKKYPTFSHIYKVVTTNGDGSGKLQGLLMENLEQYKTIYQLSTMYKENGRVFSSNEAMYILQQYLDSLSYLHQFQLSSPVIHFDNLMLNDEFKIKLIDLDGVGERKYNPKLDIDDMSTIFEPLIDMCDDAQISRFFEGISSGEITTLSQCYDALSLTPSQSYMEDPALLDTINEIQSLHHKYTGLVTLHNTRDAHEREQAIIKTAEQEFTNFPEKRQAFEFLKSKGLHTVPAGSIDFINKNPNSNTWHTLNETDVKKYFPRAFYTKFCGMLKDIKQEPTSTPTPRAKPL